MKPRVTNSLPAPSFEPASFWGEVFHLHTAETPVIGMRVLVFGAFSVLVWFIGANTDWIPTTGVAAYEIIGAVLALLLVLRTNSGYDRWYEGRKLWGGIVNQSRNLAQTALAYGPTDSAWRQAFVRWTAAFSHACRLSLRGEKRFDLLADLLTERQIAQLSAAQHMPLEVTRRLSLLLRRALDENQIDRYAFIEVEKQRALLIDHIGACERILKTPLAKSLSVKIRRFIFLYLFALPFGLFDKAGFMTPIIVMLVAYPLLSLDQIGCELQNPFSAKTLSHHPLVSICQNIQNNVMSLLETAETTDDSAAEDIDGAPQLAKTG